MITPEEFRKCAKVFDHGLAPNIDTTASSFIKNAQALGGITSRREAIIAIAQMGWESAGFTATEEWACSNGHWDAVCDTYDHAGCPEGRRYYGRGYIQLTHGYNYRACNIALSQMGMTADIVYNPDIVARDPSYAMATALWYWKTHVHDRVQNGEFGAATRAINGAMECTPSGDTSKARKRWQKLNECCQAIGTSAVSQGISEAGCY